MLNALIMRNLILLIVILWAGRLQVCTNAGITPAFRSASYPVPIILVGDATLSDPFIQPDTTTLRILLSKYVFSGVELTVLNVQSDSYRQQPYYSDVIRVDTLPGSSNFIRNRRNRIENQRRIAQVEKVLQPVLDSCFNRLLLAHRHTRSDVSNALRLAAMAASNPAYKGRQVIVVIASDLQEDILPGVPEVPHPVQFPSNVRILLIGHHPDIDLKRLFPGQTPVGIPSFHHLRML